MPAALPASSTPARTAARGSAIFALLLLLLAAASPAGAVAIEILSATQTVEADAFARSGMEFDSRVRGDGREPGDPEILTLEVETIAATSGVIAMGDAILDAALEPRGIVGRSSATSKLSLLPGVPDSEGDASASALLGVVFRVDEAFTYVLEGSLAALALAGGDAFAAIQLEDGNGALLFEAEALPGETTPLRTLLELQPGVEYGLLVVAQALSDSGFSTFPTEAAGFRFLLLPIPEPGTAAILALGLAGLAAARRVSG